MTVEDKMKQIARQIDGMQDEIADEEGTVVFCYMNKNNIGTMAVCGTELNIVVVVHNVLEYTEKEFGDIGSEVFS